MPAGTSVGYLPHGDTVSGILPSGYLVACVRCAWAWLLGTSGSANTADSPQFGSVEEPRLGLLAPVSHTRENGRCVANAASLKAVRAPPQLQSAGHCPRKRGGSRCLGGLHLRGLLCEAVRVPVALDEARDILGYLSIQRVMKHPGTRPPVGLHTLGSGVRALGVHSG